MGQKEVKNENCCGVFEMRDFERFFSEVLILPILYPMDESIRKSIVMPNRIKNIIMQPAVNEP